MKQNFQQFGFFESAPFQNGNRASEIKISKFDETKPIVFAISANTPELFKQAIKDGILYWNKAYGKEIVQVIDAPQGVSAPDLKYNIIQWVEWDAAGSAYADTQLDPRTGEVLHAQVYLTSTFAIIGKTSARHFLKNRNPTELSKKQPSPQIGLHGFSASPLCDFSMNSSFASSLSHLLNNKASDAQILKASQDYLRWVATHEVGHTLGLRHNFAGSLAMNYSLKQRDQVVKDYFDQGQTKENLTPSSTVMDYLVFEEAAMTGDQIAKKPQSLPYDEKAIQTLYYGKQFKTSEIPLFCTDSHLIKKLYVDCQPFDLSPSVVEWYDWSYQKAAKKFLLELIHHYILAKAPERGVNPVSVESVALPLPHEVSRELLLPRYKLLSLLNGKTHLLKFHRPALVDGENIEAVSKAELEFLLAEMEALGGFSYILSDIPDSLANTWTSLFLDLLEKNKMGVGGQDQNYEFSPEELNFIKNKVTRYLKQIVTDMQKTHLQLLSGTNLYSEEGLETIKLAPHKKLDALGVQIAQIARHYLLSETGEKQWVPMEIPSSEKSKDGTPLKKKVMVLLPEFKYSFELRKIAAGALNPAMSENPFWLTLTKKKSAQYFDDFMKSFLPLPLGALQADQMPTSASAQWILENQALSSSL